MPIGNVTQQPDDQMLHPCHDQHQQSLRLLCRMSSQEMRSVEEWLEWTDVEPGAEVERQCLRNRSSIDLFSMNCCSGRRHAYIPIPLHSTPTQESFSEHYSANKTRQASAISSSRPELSPQTVIYRNLLSGGITIVKRYFPRYISIWSSVCAPGSTEHRASRSRNFGSGNPQFRDRRWQCHYSTVPTWTSTVCCCQCQCGPVFHGFAEFVAGIAPGGKKDRGRLML
ncbi:hypothetical protein B0T13DRAFT_456622 [Neurospora crassa]|nr:hypothetical protein B0T13DRAFT_456622 [Neurospora crassa]